MKVTKLSGCSDDRRSGISEAVPTCMPCHIPAAWLMLLLLLLLLLSVHVPSIHLSQSNSISLPPRQPASSLKHACPIQLTRSLDDASSVGLCVVALSRADSNSLDHLEVLTDLGWLVVEYHFFVVDTVLQPGLPFNLLVSLLPVPPPPTFKRAQLKYRGEIWPASIGRNSHLGENRGRLAHVD